MPNKIVVTLDEEGRVDSVHTDLHGDIEVTVRDYKPTKDSAQATWAAWNGNLFFFEGQGELYEETGLEHYALPLDILEHGIPLNKQDYLQAIKDGLI